MPIPRLPAAGCGRAAPFGIPPGQVWACETITPTVLTTSSPPGEQPHTLAVSQDYRGVPVRSKGHLTLRGLTFFSIGIVSYSKHVLLGIYRHLFSGLLVQVKKEATQGPQPPPAGAREPSAALLVVSWPTG